MEPRRCWSNPSQSPHGAASICASFAQSRKGAPPIYCPRDGLRPKHTLKLDQQIRGAVSIDEFANILEQHMSQDIDAGSLVIALAAASKLIDERTGTKSLQRLPSWHSLLAQILKQLEDLEPRGLSMVATSAAKLAWRDECLLAKLSQEGARKASKFSITDVAKMTWAFAKMSCVEEAVEVWDTMEKEVKAKIHSAKFIEVSMIAWAFASAEMGNKTLFEAIAKASLGMIDEFPTQCLSNIAWALAKMDVSDKRLFEAIRARSRGLTAEFKDFHAVQLCWALAAADDVDFALFEALAGELVHRSLVKGFSLSMLPELAIAFTKAGMPHRLLFNDMADNLSKHVHVAETSQIAVMAWCFAMLDLRLPLIWNSFADAAKGGKLWSFPADDLVTLCWSFARVRWCDVEFFMDIVQVATHRIQEFERDSLANLMSAIVCIREGSLRGILEQSFFDDLITLLFDRYRSGRFDLHLDAAKTVVGSFGRVDRFEDAWTLAASVPQGFRTFLPFLLMEADRLDDGVRSALLWQQLANEIKDSVLQVACLNCAVMSLIRIGKMVQAIELLQQMHASGQSSSVSACLAKRIGNDASCLPLSPASHSEGQSLFDGDRSYVAYSRLLRELLADSIPGDIASVLAVMSRFDGEFHDVVDGKRNSTLADVVSNTRPRLVLEIGADAGCTALQIKANSKGHECRILALEADPIRAAVVQNIFELAGISADAFVLVGPPRESLRSVVQRQGSHSIDMLVHHGGNESCYLRDLREAADLGLLALASRGGCTLFADHVLWPGSPSLIWELCQSGHCHIKEIESSNNWIVSCLLALDVNTRGSTFMRSEVVEPMGFSSLVAEAERSWRLMRAGEITSCSSAAENLRSRFYSLVRSLSIVVQTSAKQNT